MPNKVQYTIPILHFSGNDLGALALQNTLTSEGWYATVIPQLGVAVDGGGEVQIDPNAGIMATFGAKLKEMAGAVSPSGIANAINGAFGITSARYPHAHLLVTLQKKDGSGFDALEGQIAVNAAASAAGTELAAFSDWVVNEIETAQETSQALTPSEMGATTVGYLSKSGQQMEQGLKNTLPEVKKGVNILVVLAVVAGGIWLWSEYKTTKLLAEKVAEGKPKKSKKKSKKGKA